MEPRGSPDAVRRSGDPRTAFRECERRLQHDALQPPLAVPRAPHHLWPAALAVVGREVERNARQLQRGIPGAAVLLLRSMEAGGGRWHLSRASLLEAGPASSGTPCGAVA